MEVSRRLNGFKRVFDGLYYDLTVFKYVWYCFYRKFDSKKFRNFAVFILHSLKQSTQIPTKNTFFSSLDIKPSNKIKSIFCKIPARKFGAKIGFDYSYYKVS